MSSDSPCGGEFEYFNRSPARRRRRRKGNSVSGNITRLPCFWEIQMWGSDPPGWGSLESETVKYDHQSRGTRTREWLRWRDPAAILRAMPAEVQLGKTNLLSRPMFRCRNSKGLSKNSNHYTVTFWPKIWTRTRNPQSFQGNQCYIDK
jgi:hypothetical protein